MTRLAFFTPLHPQDAGAWADTFSGITDHNEELLWRLGELVETDVVIGPYTPSPGPILKRFRVIQADEFLRHPSRYTAAIYHIANNWAQHRYMVPCMRRVPGIAVLHDCCLQHLILGLTLRQGNLRALEEILRPSHGDDARVLARKVLFGLLDPSSMSFADPVVDMSKGVIVYNDYARQCLVRDFPDRSVKVIPLGVPMEEDQRPVEALRSRHGLRPSDFILASINSLSHTKRLTVLLGAVSRLVQRYPQVRLLIVGGGSPGRGARKLIREANLHGAIVVTGWVSREAYRDLVSASDAVVDMRRHLGAETAGSLARALAAGKPAIVSAQGSFVDLPDDCCIKIPNGDGEVEAIVRAVATLVEDVPLRLRMGAAARRFASSHLSLERAARSFVEYVDELSATPVEPRMSTDPFSRTGSVAGRLAVSSVYRLSRIFYLCRHYGLADTARRFGEELGWST